MQLMPATAEDLAKRLGVAYSPERLTSDPAYNLLLGSSYLKSQLDRFGNSLLLAAAAYNAGGGNVNKWLATYGDPRDARHRCGELDRTHPVMSRRANTCRRSWPIISSTAPGWAATP